MTPIEEDDLRRELSESDIPQLRIDPAGIAAQGGRIRRRRTVVLSTLTVSAVALGVLVAGPLLGTQRAEPAGTPTTVPTTTPASSAPNTTSPDPSGTGTTQSSTTAPPSDTPTGMSPAPSTGRPTPSGLTSVPAGTLPAEGQPGWSTARFSIPLCHPQEFATSAGTRVTARMISKTESNLTQRQGVAIFATERDAQNFITTATSHVYAACGDKKPVGSGRVTGMAFEYKGPWDEGVTIGSMHEAQVNGQWRRVTGGYVTVMVRMGRVVHVSSEYGETLGMAARNDFAKGELNKLTAVITHMIPRTCQIADRC